MKTRFIVIGVFVLLIVGVSLAFGMNPNLFKGQFAISSSDNAVCSSAAPVFSGLISESALQNTGSYKMKMNNTGDFYTLRNAVAKGCHMTVVAAPRNTEVSLASYSCTKTVVSAQGRGSGNFSCVSSFGSSGGTEIRIGSNDIGLGLYFSVKDGLEYESQEIINPDGLSPVPVLIFVYTR